MKSQTPDERFLVKLYQTAMKSNDPYLGIDFYAIAKAVGLKETATKNIVKHLAQANFIKKIDEKTLHLTPHGCDFVLEELEQQ